MAARAAAHPLGIEALPRDEAEPLIDAYNDGVRELGGPFGAWGALALRPPDPDEVDALLDAGAVGISLPAGALGGPAPLERCSGVLDRLERRDAPLLVHPGPDPWLSSRPLAHGDLAARPADWRDLVHHDPAARTYEQLLRDEHVAVWRICWLTDHDTGFHDHDVSCGALVVAQGAVIEERLALGGPPGQRCLRAGESLDFAASDIHRVAHGGEGPAITINAYSPPLWRMGAYETAPGGELMRHSISYAEELRPLDLVAPG